MNKKAEITVGAILLIAIGIIVGIVLIQQIFQNQATMTTKNSVVSEVINIAPARLTGGAINTTYPFAIANAYAASSWQYRDSCTVDSITYGNATLTFTLGTDYNFGSINGTILLKNTVSVNGTAGGSPNLTYVSYSYCQDGYNQDSGSRGIASIIGLFTVIALLIFVIYMGIREWTE